MAYFKNRMDAGRQLAVVMKQRLSGLEQAADPLVLALPRGGVPVAFEVAQALQAPLDIFLVRKLGLPGQEELAMGAIASGGVRVLNEELVEALNIPDEVIDAIAQKEQRELERRESAYRDDRPAPDITGKTVILVDDGLATGASMRAAVEALQQHRPRQVIVAVPTAAPETCEAFEAMVDAVVCAISPAPFYGVGAWYDDFSQTTDEEVKALIQQAQAWRSG